MSRPFFACLLVATLAGCSPQGEAEVSPLEALAQCAEEYRLDEELEERRVEVLQELMRRAEQGSVSAQFFLCRRSGDGQRDAVELLLDASNRGNPEAQFVLASFKQSGETIGRDLAEAARLYRLAAEQEHPEAQFRLGHMLRFGEGIPTDEAEGLRWYTRAAENGHPTAQFSLGEIYGHSERYRDPVEAMRWYRAAAEQGRGAAQFALGVRFERGEGAPQDPILAHMWFNIARAQGTEVPNVIAQLEADMTPEQIAEAQAMATRCFNSGYQDCGW